MRIQASFVKDGKWWVAWTDDVPGALSQGATLEEARQNLVDAVRMVREPIDLSKLPKSKVVIDSSRYRLSVGPIFWAAKSAANWESLIQNKPVQNNGTHNSF